jgi:hypothetical protein
LSSQQCGDTGCNSPIAFRTHASGAGNGKYTATFCKASACESAEVDLPSIAGVRVEGDFILYVDAHTTDAGVEVAVTVVSAPTFDDGESLSFTLSNAAGTKLIEWSAHAKYSVRTDVGGPGCGDCKRLEPPFPE